MVRGQRGKVQIQAAGRDDQATANRNGDKPDWKRVKLGVLLDKLEEEYYEFKEKVDEGDREGMRLEGADLRWCVTMIQDHQGVLEVEEGRARSVPGELRIFVPAQIVVGLGIVGYGAGQLLVGLAKLWRKRKER